jgi:hypothetical protein
MGDLFDPTTATVDQVNAYLATASPEEIERVLAAEAQGKNRATVTVPKATPKVCPICFPQGLPEGYTAVGCEHSAA